MASLILSGPLTMIIGIALWHGTQYRTVGRVMFFVSTVTFFLEIGLIVGYGLFG